MTAWCVGGIGLRLQSVLFSTQGGDAIQSHPVALLPGRTPPLPPGSHSVWSCLDPRAGLAASETIKDLFYVPESEPSFPGYWIYSYFRTWAAISVLLLFLINFLEVAVKVNCDPLSSILQNLAVDLRRLFCFLQHKSSSAFSGNVICRPVWMSGPKTANCHS